MLYVRTNVQSTDRQLRWDHRNRRDWYLFATAFLLLLASLASTGVNFVCGCYAADQSYIPSQISFIEDDKSDSHNGLDGSDQGCPSFLAADSSRSCYLPKQCFTADRRGLNNAGCTVAGGNFARGPPALIRERS